MRKEKIKNLEEANRRILWEAQPPAARPLKDGGEKRNVAKYNGSDPPPPAAPAAMAVRSKPTKMYTQAEVIELLYQYTIEQNTWNYDTDRATNFSEPNAANYVDAERIRQAVTTFMEQQ